MPPNHFFPEIYKPLTAFQLYKNDQPHATAMSFHQLPGNVIMQYSLRTAHDNLDTILQIYRGSNVQELSVTIEDIIMCFMVYLRECLEAAEKNSIELIDSSLIFKTAETMGWEMFHSSSISLEKLQQWHHLIEAGYFHHINNQIDCTCPSPRTNTCSTNSEESVSSPSKHPTPLASFLAEKQGGNSIVSHFTCNGGSQLSPPFLMYSFSSPSLPLFAVFSEKSPILSQTSLDDIKLSALSREPRRAKRFRQTTLTNSLSSPASSSRGTTSNGAESLVSFFGRSKTLHPSEKKVVGQLQQCLVRMALMVATRTNEIPSFLNELKELLATLSVKVAKEQSDQQTAKGGRKGGIVGGGGLTSNSLSLFEGVSFLPIEEAISSALEAYYRDEENLYEQDDDLLHPVAYAILSTINMIEGYETYPFIQKTEEETLAKQAQRAAMKAKREAILQREEAKKQERAEKEHQREITKRFLSITFGDFSSLHLTEERDQTSLRELVPVSYASLPFPAEYYTTLRWMWAMLYSVPKALLLSQMRFEHFLNGFLSDRTDNLIIEEILRQLVNTLVEDSSNPGSALRNRRLLTRGKHWFDATVDYLRASLRTRELDGRQRLSQLLATQSYLVDHVPAHGIANEEPDEGDTLSPSSSPLDPHEPPAFSPHLPSSNMLTQDGEGREGSLDSTTFSPCGETPSSPAFSIPLPSPAQPSEDERLNFRMDEDKEEEEVDGTEDPENWLQHEPLWVQEMSDALTRISKQRSLAAWVNLETHDRMAVLSYLTHEVLGTVAVQEEAERVYTKMEEVKGELEKNLRESREEAEKEFKALGDSSSREWNINKTNKGSNENLSNHSLNFFIANSLDKEKGGEDRPHVIGEGAPEKSVLKFPRREEDSSTHIEKPIETENREACSIHSSLTPVLSARELLIKCWTEKVEKLWHPWYQIQQGKDTGAIISPLGSDRYQRLYWYFPEDDCVMVQTTYPEVEFPLIKEFSFSLIEDVTQKIRMAHSSQSSSPVRLVLDEEETTESTHSPSNTLPSDKIFSNTPTDILKTEGVNSLESPQSIWGTLTINQLPDFINSLDDTGVHEGPLKFQLRIVLSFLKINKRIPFTELRMTRGRLATMGYTNYLRFPSYK